jgi:hypothetical protein
MYFGALSTVGEVTSKQHRIADGIFAEEPKYV